MVQFPWAPASPTEKPTKDVCYTCVCFQARLLLPMRREEEGRREQFDISLYYFRYTYVSLTI